MGVDAMNCREVQDWISDEPVGATAPEQVRAHLEACDGCRRFAGRDAAVRRLVALKRFEQPDPLFDVRLVARVRSEIGGTRPERGWLSGWTAWLPSPFVRYSVAAAALVALSIPVLRVAMVPHAATPTVVQESPATPRPDGTRGEGPPILTLREVASTAEPATTNVLDPDRPNVQYGPGRSATVDLKY